MLWWALGWCFLLAFINSCYKIAQCLLRDYSPKLVAQDGLNSQFIAKAELSTQEWFIFDRKLLVVKICNEVQRINRSWGDYLMSSMPIQNLPPISKYQKKICILLLMDCLSSLFNQVACTVAIEMNEWMEFLRWWC